MHPVRQTTPSAAAGKRPDYGWLTVLRGVFITWIVLRHFSHKGGPASWISDALPGFRTFDIPTTCFFVLSGLIFALGKVPEFGWSAIKSFWLARIGRLYPLYALAVLACAPIGWVAAKGDPGVFAFSGFADLTFLQGWFREPHYASWLLVGWFMSSLAFCYLVYPIIAPFILRLRPAWLILLAVALALYAWAMGIYWDAVATDRTSVEMVRRIPAASLPLFALGVCFGALVNQGLIRLASRIATAMALITVYVLGMMTPNGWHLFVATPLWPAILLPTFFIRTAPPAWAVLYGELGFTLYMLHWPLLIYSKKLLKLAGLGEHFSSPPYLMALLLILIPMAYVVYNRFERPAQGWLRRRLAPVGA